MSTSLTLWNYGGLKPVQADLCHNNIAVNYTHTDSDEINGQFISPNMSRKKNENISSICEDIDYK